MAARDVDPLPLVLRVVQHRRVLVEGDDVGVGQFLFRLIGRAEVGEVDLVLRLAGTERALGGAMAACAANVRLADAFDLVVGLPRAFVVKTQHQRLGVHGRAIDEAVVLRDDGDVPVREVPLRVGSVADDLDVELIDPEPLRCAGGLVPVVDRLVVDERRLAAGSIDDEAVRVVDDRYPPLEVRVHLEGIRIVVEELHAKVARRDDQGVEPTLGERLIGALANGLDVRRKQRGELVVVGRSHGAGGYDEMSGARWPFCRGMDTKRWTVAFAATAILGGCATKTPVTGKTPQPMLQPGPAAIKDVPKETPASSLVDHAGDSVETAIAVPADAPNEGYDFMNNWIYDRIGRFRRDSGGTRVSNRPS